MTKYRSLGDQNTGPWRAQYRSLEMSIKRPEILPLASGRFQRKINPSGNIREGIPTFPESPEKSWSLTLSMYFQQDCKSFGSDECMTFNMPTFVDLSQLRCGMAQIFVFLGCIKKMEELEQFPWVVLRLV